MIKAAAVAAAAAIRIGRKVRVHGQAGPESCGFVAGYCSVLATHCAVATSCVRAMSRSAASKPKPG
jgi:predicted metal-binding membrane protein